ncbi:uncharacterized protein LOC120014364 isoform X2 [Tripterygium wilfordii]|uniref:uncharacterized protein LOC120014364 isoform X2 n=1 Tax=Tripterygium wilfordii TaxID=458696 RepID=UPI0018F8033C|nr:uncharacterized protein LOC120014364 isoform X2 [Tripterygium wilfordii]
MEMQMGNTQRISHVMIASIPFYQLPNDAYGNKVLDDKEPQAAPNANFATSAGINAKELEVHAGPSHSTPDFPKPHDRLLNCTLNSEDPEIPSNDDVFLHRPFTASLAIIVSKEASNLISVFPNWEGCDHLHLTNREEIPSKSSVTSCIPDNYLPLASHGIKSEFPNSNYHHMFSRIAPRNRSQLRSAFANSSFASDGVFDRSLSSRYSSDTPLCAIGTIKGLLRPKATTPTTDHEESDDDIPCFSDIEAMILQMDLSPDDEDSNVLEKVSRYQHEDTKKKIIRLEQCAHSSMQRAIASKGAFAILHGCRLKHYIKETEVILGRATDETDVDIDLRREGCANKISRRQALIRMGEDGSFFLKNLGKSSMFVNGKEVTTGQHMHLTPSCLIEMSNGKFADQGIGICV